jgi:predicted DNA-binding transcriptional regulator YafY
MITRNASKTALLTEENTGGQRRVIAHDHPDPTPRSPEPVDVISGWLAFSYTVRDGTVSSRAVEPHRLVHTGRRWYLVARDLDRDDWRTFRVDRMDAPQDTGIRFVPRDPPDAASFVAAAVTAAQYQLRARVLMHAPAHVVAEQVPPTSGVIEPVDVDTCLLTTGADALDSIAFHLAWLGVDFTVLEPPELIEHVRALADRLRRAVP